MGADHKSIIQQISSDTFRTKFYDQIVKFSWKMALHFAAKMQYMSETISQRPQLEAHKLSKTL